MATKASCAPAHSAEGIAQSHTGDTGQPFQSQLQLLKKRQPLRRLRIFLLTQGEFRRNDVLRVHSQRLRLQIVQAAHEQKAPASRMTVSHT